MAKKPLQTRLAEFESSREQYPLASRPVAKGSPPCAASAVSPEQGERGDAGFLSESNGIKINPEMRFLALFRGTRAALFAPTGEQCTWLSQGLSLLRLAVGPVTARKYVHAVRRLLDAGRADVELIHQLAESEGAARRAITRLLSRAGCRLEHHRLSGGAVLVWAPQALVPCVDTALTALGHCYTLLGDRGAIDFDPIHNRELQPAPLPDARHRRPMRRFVVANRHRCVPLTADPHCAELVRELSRRWPPGVRAAILFTADHGQRISETLALTVADWAASNFGDWVTCPNKGSRGARTKKLYLDAAQIADLAAYFDGPRQELTGFSLADLKRLHRRNPDHPALRQPLFLNTLGRRISYSLVNDHYWRPAVRKSGSAATPHWTRHEKATDGLLAIRAIARDRPGEEEHLVRTFAGVMGWASGLDMVFYYAAPVADFDQREVLARIAAAQEVAPAPRPECRADDRVSRAFAAFVAGRVE